MKILLVEDSATAALLTMRTMRLAKHEVKHVHDGLEALESLEGEVYDIVITDWLMERMDGIEFVRRARENGFSLPVVFVTSMVGDKARAHALSAGADACITKPFSPGLLLDTVHELTGREAIGDTIDFDEDEPEAEGSEPSRKSEAAKPSAKSPLERTSTTRATAAASSSPTASQRAKPASSSRTPTRVARHKPAVEMDFSAICLAASTGGPNAVVALVSSLAPSQSDAVLAVLHGPAWMLETYQVRLQRSTEKHVVLGWDGCKIEAGKLYLAPGDVHMVVEAGREPVLRLDPGPKVHFVRPAADPLFRSAAEAFGADCLGVVMTGLGQDGTEGCAAIAQAGGTVLVQDPSTCVATPMPLAVINSDTECKVHKLDRLAGAIGEWSHSRERKRRLR